MASASHRRCRVADDGREHGAPRQRRRLVTRNSGRIGDSPSFALGVRARPKLPSRLRRTFAEQRDPRGLSTSRECSPSSRRLDSPVPRASRRPRCSAHCDCSGQAEGRSARPNREGSDGRSCVNQGPGTVGNRIPAELSDTKVPASGGVSRSIWAQNRLPSGTLGWVTNPVVHYPPPATMMGGYTQLQKCMHREHPAGL